MDASLPSEPEQLAAHDYFAKWLATLETENPAVAAVVVDDESDADRWFVRVRGEAKDVYSVWFTMGQRTLQYETYVMPEPDENFAEFYAQLLRRNHHLRELAFSLGKEGVFLRGQLDVRSVDPEALDRILGTVYAAIELCFVPALRIGFASRMK